MLISQRQNVVDCCKSNAYSCEYYRERLIINQLLHHLYLDACEEKSMGVGLKIRGDVRIKSSISLLYCHYILVVLEEILLNYESLDTVSLPHYTDIQNQNIVQGYSINLYYHIR